MSESTKKLVEFAKVYKPVRSLVLLVLDLVKMPDWAKRIGKAAASEIPFSKGHGPDIK